MGGHHIARCLDQHHRAVQCAQTKAQQWPPLKAESLAVIVVVVAIAVFAVVYRKWLSSRIPWSKSRWLRNVITPELPGAIATVLGIVLAVVPQLVNDYRWPLMAATVMIAAAFAVTWAIRSSREEKRLLSGLAGESMALSAELYALIGERKFDGTCSAPYLANVRRGFFSNRFRLLNFFPKLTECDVDYPNRLESLARAATANPGSASLENIEELAEGFWVLATAIERLSNEA